MFDTFTYTFVPIDVCMYVHTTKHCSMTHAILQIPKKPFQFSLFDLRISNEKNRKNPAYKKKLRAFIRISTHTYIFTNVR